MTKKKQKSTPQPTVHYTPSSQMADNLLANREGFLTSAQRAPIVAAAIVSGIGLVVMLIVAAIVLWGFIQAIQFMGWLGVCTSGFMAAAFLFILVTLWTNAEMFVPETFNKRPVRWQRGILTIKMASRKRPEMPFSYIIGSYSFHPFLAPDEVPMQTGREYVVYYTARSRLFLGIFPTDQADSAQWLPPDTITASEN